MGNGPCAVRMTSRSAGTNSVISGQFGRRQNELVDDLVAFDHGGGSRSAGASSACSAASLPPQNRSSIARSSASRSARARYQRRFPSDRTLTPRAGYAIRGLDHGTGGDA